MNYINEKKSHKPVSGVGRCALLFMLAAGTYITTFVQKAEEYAAEVKQQAQNERTISPASVMATNFEHHSTHHAAHPVHALVIR